MHRTSMGAIVSASAALVAMAALVGAGCSTQTATPADAPTASTLEPATISGDAKGGGNPVSAEDVQALWAPVAAAAAEGGYTAWGTVVDAQTGEVLLDASAATPHTPASTTKTLAAFSALHHLDPTATLTTSALLGADNQTLYLDSEGDLLLGIGTSDEVEVSGRAGLQTLAKDTAAALTQRGITSVTLNWRGTLFDGASHLSSWDAQEVGSYEGHVGPMAIDAGRTYEGANAFYADAPGRVAEVFSQALGAAGITATTAGAPGTDANADSADRGAITLASIWEFAHEFRLGDVDALISHQIGMNQAISSEGLSGRWGANIGSTLLKSRPNDISTKARAAAAAGSDARMSGCPLPVMICCGSGNQGITCSQPVLEYAHDLWADHETLVRAVVLSDLTAVHVKYFIGELSAFCGAVSAGCGAGGGICYLRGGSFAQFEATIVNTLANVGGIVCDGAKPSCAAKICAAVDAAILGCDMALADDNFLAGDGLVGKNAEETIRSMGYVGRVGMHPTDVEILNIMIGKTDLTGA